LKIFKIKNFNYIV
jgi:hypothetical protein